MTSLRERFTLRPGRHRPRPIRNGAILTALLALVAYWVVARQLPFMPEGGTVVRAHVADATHLDGRAPVRVAGVDVGKVEEVELGPDGRGATVTLRIDDGAGVDVHADARLAVWWRTLFGRNTYVELDPGTSGTLGDRTIPLARTQVQQEFDQVIGTLGVDQRRSMRQTIEAFDEGMKDPDAVGGTLEALAPAGRHMRDGLPALRGSNPGDLTELVGQASRTMGALGADERQLAGLVDSGRTALGVTAARSDSLGSMLDQAPPTMDDTRATLARLRTTFDALDPVADRMLPGARRVKPAADAARPMLARLDSVLDDAEPAVRSLRPAVTRLAQMAGPGRQVIEELRPTVDRGNRTLLPWLGETDPETKLRNYAAIGPFFSAQASASSTFDANGYMFNIQPGAGDGSLMPLKALTRMIDGGRAGR